MGHPSDQLVIDDQMGPAFRSINDLQQETSSLQCIVIKINQELDEGLGEIKKSGG
jgi:hypothetical protein